MQSKWYEPGSDFERRLEEFGTKVTAVFQAIVAVAFFAALLWVFWAFFFVPAAINSVWYALIWGVRINNVTVNVKPTDCDWGRRLSVIKDVIIRRL